jgi:hypothetical protein
MRKLQPGIPVTYGTFQVLKERSRQEDLGGEGYNAEHDDQHKRGELTDAAINFAAAASVQIKLGGAKGFDASPPLDGIGINWPWHRKHWKPKDHRRNLIIAAALLLAEIDRVDRAEPPAPEAETRRRRRRAKA